MIVDFVAAIHDVGLRRNPNNDCRPVFTPIQMIQILLFRHARPCAGIHGIGTDCAPVSWMAGTTRDEPGHDE